MKGRWEDGQGGRMDEVGGHCNGITSGYEVIDTRLSPEDWPGLETQGNISQNPSPATREKSLQGINAKGL